MTEPKMTPQPNPDADQMSSRKNPRSFIFLIPVALVVGIALGALFGYLYWGRELEQSQKLLAEFESAQQAAAVQTPTSVAPAQEQEIRRYEVPEDDDPVFGPEDAPITIIEFSDYQCPYCARWHEQVFLRLREEYPDTIRVVFRDFPLTSIHPEAVPAAEAANCAGEQDAYWEFHDALFSGQNGFGKDAYTSYASDLGLDMVGFTECIESGRHNDEVMADLSYAAELGVQSTPTFFLNGLPIVGAQPYEVFEQIIKQELAGEIP
jgi:protein-disulfide isomerase